MTARAAVVAARRAAARAAGRCTCCCTGTPEDRARPCTHTWHNSGSWITWYDCEGVPTDEVHGVTRRCLYCRQTQPLGHAEDGGVPFDELELAARRGRGYLLRATTGVPLKRAGGRKRRRDVVSSCPPIRSKRRRA